MAADRHAIPRLTLKLLFFRPKDLEDCKRAVALLGDSLDVAYVTRQLLLHVGDDERSRRWTQIVAEYGKPSTAG